MEARNRSLVDWFTRIRTRQLALPRFQRFEAWTYTHVTGLLNTVLRELPAGALLVLEIGEKEPFASRTMQGAPTEGERVSEHLLDGQQRLTALWRSLTNDYTDRTYLVEVVGSGEEAEDEFSGPPRAVSFGRWERNGQKYPLWLDEPTKVWDRGMIPVALLRPDSEAEAAFKLWARNVAGDDSETLIQLIEIGSELRVKFAQFNLPFLSLPSSTHDEVAVDVFVKMNTSAQPLTTYDIVVAQVEARTGFSLHELVDELKREAPELDIFADPAKIVLDAGAYIQNKSSQQSVLLKPEFCEDLIEKWDLLVKGAQRATAFLEEEGVLDAKRLPTEPIVPLLVALWAYAPDGMDGEGQARTVLRKLLWRSFFTDRYELASNTRALADYRGLRDTIAGKSDSLPPIFDDDLHPAPTIDDLLLAGWPKKKDRLGRAILLVALKNGGLDLADASPVTRENLRRREYHHLYPTSLLRDQDFSDNQIYKALNCALVTWKTNRHIAAKSPDEYLRQRIDAANLGEDEIRERVESHLIDYDAFRAGDYEAFLAARAEMIHPLAVELCS